MTQITRCPSCGTRFKVVADQLRISQGWVRCGVCQNVFDASLDLLELPDDVLQNAGAQAAAAQAETSQPTPLQHAVDGNALPESGEPAVAPDVRTPIPATSTAEEATPFDVMAPTPAPVLPGRIAEASETAAESVPDIEERHPSGDEPFLESLFEPSFVDQAMPLHGSAVEQVPVAPEPVQELAASDDAVANPPAAFLAESGREPFEDMPSTVSAVQDAEPAGEPSFAPSSAFADDAQRARRQVQAEQKNDGDEDARESDEDEAEPALPAAEAEPGFVRQARRKAFWHSTAVRGMLLLACVTAAGGLATQMLWQKRDALAVQYPSLQPVLRTMCLAAGCKLQARREISDVVISSSGFKQMQDQHQYLWSLSLENRSEVPVAMPLAELTLTDAQDKPLLRRVVELVPLGAPSQLRGHEEWSVSVPVQVQELSAPVAGYRALVFYP